MHPRRDFFKRLLTLGAGASALAHSTPAKPAPPRVITPDIADLPFTMDGSVKVFHLVAEPVKQTIVPGRTLDLWGFNGSAPGPTIQATEGDRVRIVFENHLPEPTGIHWHGLELPIEMDGVPGLGQKPIAPGGRFVYEFALHQNGTFFYHSHMAMQEMVGLLGGFIIHPRTAWSPPADKDYFIALQEYAVLPNSTVPNSMKMEFNWLTFNGKAGPAATPLIVRQGERVRIRLVNLGMDHHPIHLHGFTFWETGREGARQPEAIWPRGNTVLVGVAQARDIEFIADRAGDWMFHCHLPHHMMNQMTSVVGPMTRQGEGMPMPELPANANQVPLFPQDAYMEGPMMAMDKEVEKPETYGLPAGWSGYVGGMMTLVRVLPPEQYQKIMDLKARHPENAAQ
ncbi:MAG TPA: copper oxidase [Bryobacteraceae bacterium]|nr:copper oxidase [Bryobacteraceae bacterium]